MLDVFGACSPTREECVKMLKVGSPVAVKTIGEISSVKTRCNYAADSNVVTQ